MMVTLTFSEQHLKFSNKVKIKVDEEACHASLLFCYESIKILLILNYMVPRSKRIDIIVFSYKHGAEVKKTKTSFFCVYI